MRRKTANRFVFLDKTQEETARLLEVTKQYFNTRSKEDREHLVGDAKLAYAVVLSNIAVKLTSTLQWLNEIRSLDENTPIDAISPTQYRLYKLDDRLRQDENFYGYMPLLVTQLAYASSALYERVSRLEEALWRGGSIQDTHIQTSADLGANVLQLKFGSDREAPVSAKG
jgi:hypothetical protein